MAHDATYQHGACLITEVQLARALDTFKSTACAKCYIAQTVPNSKHGVSKTWAMLQSGPSREIGITHPVNVVSSFRGRYMRGHQAAVDGLHCYILRAPLGLIHLQQKSKRP